MSLSAIRRPDNAGQPSYRGRETSLLLVLVMMTGVAAFVPDDILNLRVQESLFPIVAMFVFVCGMVAIYIDMATGAFGFFIAAMSLWRLTPDSYAFMILAALYFGMYFAIVWARDEIVPRRSLIYNAVCVFALVNVLWIALQVNEIYLIFHPVYHDSAETGWFANRNESGVFLAIALPLFFRGKWWLGVIPMAAGIVMAKCTTGAIAAIVVTGAYLAFRMMGDGGAFRRKFRAGLIAALAVLLCVSGVYGYMTKVHHGGISSRAAAYWESLPVIGERPWLGWGIGQSTYILPLWINAESNPEVLNRDLFGKVYHQKDFADAFNGRRTIAPGEFLRVMWTHLHNEYLQWAMDAGIVGLALLAWLVIGHGFRFYRTEDRDWCAFLSVVAALITANAFFTFQIGRFTFLTVVSMALIQGQYMMENQPRIPVQGSRE